MSSVLEDHILEKVFDKKYGEFSVINFKTEKIGPDEFGVTVTYSGSPPRCNDFICKLIRSSKYEKLLYKLIDSEEDSIETGITIPIKNDEIEGGLSVSEKDNQVFVHISGEKDYLIEFLKKVESTLEGMTFNCNCSNSNYER